MSPDQPTPPNSPMPRPSQHAFQAPTGTRDFYPEHMLRRRYLERAWRDASIRHGFDEIDGPTFEHLDLYTVKSGEGIVSELFSFERSGGEKTYALRPEFTPTLARMYAAKASTLPRPTKWFCMPSFFRAERPQRGRLREFFQWNCDILGDPSPVADAELIACAVDAFASLGLSPQTVRFRLSHRAAVEGLLRRRGVTPEKLPAFFSLLDRIGKISNDAYVDQAKALGMETSAAMDLLRLMVLATPFENPTTQTFLSEDASGKGPEYFKALFSELRALGVADWCLINLGIVRGLAYYTGMVFEVHETSGGERAVAGGGRYDGLIELFGGPPTPAVGFGMGDAVLGLILGDKDLIPSEPEMMERLSERPASWRPDVFVISAGGEDADAAVSPALAGIRTSGLHARRSYKTTRNVGKLLKDAVAAKARLAVIIEPGGIEASIKNLDSGVQLPVPVPVSDLVIHIGRALQTPT